MTHPAPTTSLHRLRRDECLCLPRPRGLCLRAERGTLWVTIDGEPDDIELEAGQSRVFDSQATVVIGTLGGGAVLSTTVRAPVPWAERLRHWLGGSTHWVGA